MKSIISAAVGSLPLIAIIIIVTYIIEEVVEDFYSEMISDFVYPVGALLVLAVVWYKVIPAIQAHLSTEPSQPTPPAPDTKE